MAIIRTEKKSGFTIISNKLIRDKNISEAAKMMEITMLSKPDNWVFSVAALAAEIGYSRDKVSRLLKELEAAGYVTRRRIRENGRFGKMEYIVHDEPVQVQPATENPAMESPAQEAPAQDNASQLNNINTNTEEINNIANNTYPSISSFRQNEEADEMDAMDAEAVKEEIREQIDYEVLITKEDPSQVDDLVDIMQEIFCASPGEKCRVNGIDFSIPVVQKRFRQLTGEHIEYVLDCLKGNDREIRNVRSYLITSLFNAPTTIGSYYQARVNHDRYERQKQDYSSSKYDGYIYGVDTF